MSRKYEINKLILNEIDCLKTENHLKEFLKEVLYFEIGNIGETRFSEEYEKMLFKSLKAKEEKR